jgi:hypothetical protein
LVVVVVASSLAVFAPPEVESLAEVHVESSDSRCRQKRTSRCLGPVSTLSVAVEGAVSWTLSGRSLFSAQHDLNGR